MLTGGSESLVAVLHGQGTWAPCHQLGAGPVPDFPNCFLAQPAPSWVLLGSLFLASLMPPPNAQGAHSHMTSQHQDDGSLWGVWATMATPTP